MKKKEMIAMILAGGQGARLLSLTTKVAKPAVPYGGKYRIIDFTLSNCANSNIDTVGILTQYQPLSLNSHVGIGIPWDLDRRHGGVKILPPYTSEEGGRWYLGTANAVYENLNFVDMHDPEYVLVLSGDHIYKMDYQKMLAKHKAAHADVTISVIRVPLEEASRFGILNTDENLKIISFDEKPKEPKSDLASMGIYIFKWSVLRAYLVEDNLDPMSDHDFGKDIIPKMLKDQLNLIGYVFDDYWKDVGTIKSFWEGNMDLLDRQSKFDLYDSKWRIYTKNDDLPAHYIGEEAVVENSMVNEGCEVNGMVKNSILFTKIVVGKGAQVIDSVIFPGVVIEPGAIVHRAIVMNNHVVKSTDRIGSPDSDDIVLVGSGDDTGYLE